MKPFCPHVLVFDSGVGGLSIVQHLRDTLPAVSITYLADTLFFPYGMLKEEALVERVIDLLSRAAETVRPDLIVVACNTASTLVLPALRMQLTIPIVGVVPAIKPAAQLSATKVIGLLATPGTIRRDYTDELIADFAPDCEVIRVGCSQLVQIVESTMQGIEHAPAVFTEVLSPFYQHPRAAKLDTIVLACTHFPLVKTQLAAAAPNIRHWVDSGAAIARRVRQLLAQEEAAAAPAAALSSTPAPAHGDQALLTGEHLDNSGIRRCFAGFGFYQLSHFH